MQEEVLPVQQHPRSDTGSDGSAHTKCLRGTLPFAAPVHAPAPHANPEELLPAPERLPDPDSDVFLRRTVHVPDFATTLPRPWADSEGTSCEADTDMAPEHPVAAHSTNVGVTTNFSRGTGHVIFAADGTVDVAALEGIQYSKLDLHPDFDAIRTAARRVHIAREAITKRRQLPASLAVECARAQAALERGVLPDAGCAKVAL